MDRISFFSLLIISAAVTGWCYGAPAAVSDNTDQLAPKTGYPHSSRGTHMGTISEQEVSPSLSRNTPSQHYIPYRHAGAATPGSVLNHEVHARQSHAGDAYQFFAPTPLKYMPYLDSVYILSNNAIQPGALIEDDLLSSGAQYVKTGLSRIGITYSGQTMVGYTGFTGGASMSGRHSYGSDHTSLLINGTIFRERSTGNGLFLTTAIKQGNGFDFNADEDNPQKNIGAQTNVSGFYQRQGTYLNQLAFGYASCGGKLMVMGGMIDPGNYLDKNSYAGSASTEMINKAFCNSPVYPLYNPGLGLNISFQPIEKFYVMMISASSNTPSKHNPFDYLNSNNWVNLFEFGVVCSVVMGLGNGIYRFQPFYVTTGGEDGVGLAINFQQQLGKKTPYGWFLRAGVADSNAAMLTNVRYSASTGLVLHAPFSLFGTTNEKALNLDYLGLGVTWLQAAKKTAKTNACEYGLELTYTIQVTPTMTIQPDIQVIRNPIYGKRKDQTNVVLQLQTNWQF